MSKHFIFGFLVCLWKFVQISVQLTENKLMPFCSNISPIDAEQILRVTEFVRFVSDVIQTFPGNITESGWDFIRIAISSWVLTLSKSSEHLKTPKVQRMPNRTERERKK